MTRPVEYATWDDNTDWMAEAACTGEDPELFFPDRGRGAAREAKAICRSCPVQPDCLAFALRNHIIHGVWGGESERGRRRGRAGVS